MVEFKDQISDSEVEDMKKHIADVREKMKDESLSGDDLRKEAGSLQQASLKLFEAAYKSKASQQGHGDSHSSSEGPSDNATDADFKEKK